MSFSMSPFPLRFGSRRGGGGGDPTAITPANADALFTALGAAQAGTGATWGETGQAATPLYAVAAAKVPLAYDAELGVFGPIVNPAGTNLALRDRDATHTAWSKSNMTAAQVYGSLDSDYLAGETRRNLLTYTQAITNAAWTKFRYTATDGAALAPDGSMTATRLLETADTNSRLVRQSFTFAASQISSSAYVKGGLGRDFVVLGQDDNTNRTACFNITTGAVASAGSAVNASITDVGDGWYLLTVTTTESPTSGNFSIGGRSSGSGSYYDSYAGDTAKGFYIWSPQFELGSARTSHQIVTDGYSQFHTLLTATGTNATALQAITSASNPRVSKLWLARANGSGTISLTQDNGSTWADVTPGTDPLPFDVAAATLANPTIGVRIATSGDSIRLYGVPHQVAARPLRPYIGPTAGSTVTTGARTMICTLSESPSLVSLKLRFRTPTVSIAGQTVFSVDNNAATNLIDLKADGSGGFVLRKVIASSETAFSPFAVAVNTLVQVDIEISASVFRYRIDGGSWVDGTAGIPGSLSRFRIGHDNANAGQLGQPVLALDELSTAAMMTGDRGWNKESLI